jgi:hypothetical protein
MWSTKFLLKVAGINRRTLERMERQAGIFPAYKGSKGPGNGNGYDHMQVLGICYAAELIRGNWHHQQAYAAGRWVSQQRLAVLRLEFAAGRKWLLPGAPGLSQLTVEKASRQQRIYYARFDLEASFERSIKRPATVVPKDVADAFYQQHQAKKEQAERAAEADADIMEEDHEQRPAT